ncbi:calcium/sodium antiporter [Puniceicoccales bacterium CK1056]|uniref:Calcium/sodium antiporter n=1 Tax=Oceanipulchritudo coccoides TaxID=2706888 RepID=A0A6B2M0Y6_9BACT|nr:calcium/sodium antiporter [Oceanipulchritudo coccoides]NDV61764.1 calcium/sodium antiporter [Oceanipulchritudo coccoides]
MEAWIQSLVQPIPLWGLFIIIAVFLYTLAKGADILVVEAVTLSIRWGVPPLLIGATIVSLGTTLPETAVSVAAALGGRPGLALGNAVGSIICDTGLILGIAALMRPIPLDKTIVNRQGWIQLGSGFLLVAMCLPWSSLGSVFSEGGRLPRWGGWLFLFLLVVYIWKSIDWARKGEAPEQEETHADSAKMPIVLLKLALGMALVILSSKVLIPTVEETAFRLHVPEAIIAATLVAFGTSLPELVTVVTSVRRGHGGLALGNVIGADILNVLFVAGASAAVTPGGLYADPKFFSLLFPAMIFVLLVFRISVWVSGTHMRRWTGFVLLGAYILVTLLSYSR